jgi:hypothetical protein
MDDAILRAFVEEKAKECGRLAAEYAKQTALYAVSGVTDEQREDLLIKVTSLQGKVDLLMELCMALGDAELNERLNKVIGEAFGLPS